MVGWPNQQISSHTVAFSLFPSRVGVEIEGHNQRKLVDWCKDSLISETRTLKWYHHCFITTPKPLLQTQHHIGYCEEKKKIYPNQTHCNDFCYSHYLRNLPDKISFALTGNFHRRFQKKTPVFQIKKYNASCFLYLFLCLVRTIIMRDISFIIKIDHQYHKKNKKTAEFGRKEIV